MPGLRGNSQFISNVETPQYQSDNDYAPAAELEPLETPAEINPQAIREITQTDVINQRLLVALLEHLKTADNLPKMDEKYLFSDDDTDTEDEEDFFGYENNSEDPDD